MSSLPTVNARAMLAALGTLGLDASAIQREAGIDDTTLADSDRELPMPVYIALWMSAQVRWQRPHLGAHTGANVPIGAYQLLDYLVASCPSVGEALDRLARYTRVVCSALDLVVVRREASDAPVDVRIQVDESAAPVLSEFVAALIAARLRQYGPPGGLRAVELSHEGSEDLSPIFRCPVRFGAGRNALIFSGPACSAPLHRRDAELLRILERHARQLIGGEPHEPPLSRVRAAIGRGLEAGDVRVGVVASGLGMSARKLQQLLHDAGTSFQEVLDEERSALARAYLRGANLSIAEVAYMLGYAEPSAFTRAFKRWTGSSPQAFRSLQRASSRGGDH